MNNSCFCEKKMPFVLKPFYIQKRGSCFQDPLSAVRLVGLEPTRCHQRQILSLMRLPVPPQAHIDCLNILSQNPIECKRNFSTEIIPCKKLLSSACLAFHSFKIFSGYIQPAYLHRNSPAIFLDFSITFSEVRDIPHQKYLLLLSP